MEHWAEQLHITPARSSTAWVHAIRSLEASPQQGRLFLLEAQLDAFFRVFIETRESLGHSHWMSLSGEGTLTRQPGLPLPLETAWIQSHLSEIFHISPQGFPETTWFFSTRHLQKRFSEELEHLYAPDIAVHSIRLPRFPRFWRQSRFLRANAWQQLEPHVRTHLGLASIWRIELTFLPGVPLLIKLQRHSDSHVTLRILSGPRTSEVPATALRNIAAVLGQPGRQTEILNTSLTIEETIQKLSLITRNLHVLTHYKRAYQSLNCEQQLSFPEVAP